MAALSNDGSTNAYYTYINVKTKRPWFEDINFNRRIINLITRIRTGHHCTTDHFERLNCNRELICGCGSGNMDLRHIICFCPLYSRGRERFLEFLSSGNSDTSDPVIHVKRAALQLWEGICSEFNIFFGQTSIIIYILIKSHYIKYANLIPDFYMLVWALCPFINLNFCYFCLLSVSLRSVHLFCNKEDGGRGRRRGRMKRRI